MMPLTLRNLPAIKGEQQGQFAQSLFKPSKWLVSLCRVGKSQIAGVSQIIVINQIMTVTGGAPRGQPIMLKGCTAVVVSHVV